MIVLAARIFFNVFIITVSGATKVHQGALHPNDAFSASEALKAESQRSIGRSLLSLSTSQWSYSRVNADESLPMFLDLWRTDFWPSFVDAIDELTANEDEPLWETASGDWFSVSLSLGGFHMDPLVEAGDGDGTQVSITTMNNENALQVELVMTDIFAKFQNIRYSYNFFVASCDGASLEASAFIPTLTAKVAVWPTENSGGKNVSVEILDLNFDDDFSITMQPALGNRNCETTAEMISSLVTGLASIAPPFVSNIENKVLEWVGANFFTFPMDEPPMTEYAPGAYFHYAPILGNLQSVTSPLQEDADELHVQLGGLFYANLTEPAWRNGFSYQPEVVDAVTSPPTERLTQMVEANFYQNGVDALLDVLWYLQWSSWADNALGLQSSLCQPEALDPCPFPPLVEDVPRRTTLSRLLRAAYFSRGSGSSFRTEMILPSIQVDILDHNVLRATGTGTVQVLAVDRNETSEVKLIAALSVPITLTSDAPGFNDELQVFDALKIRTVAHGRPEIVSGGRIHLLLRRALTRAAVWSAVKLVNRMRNRVDAQINTLLESVPLPLDNFTNIPLPQEVLKMFLRQVNRSTHHGEDQSAEASFIHLDGQLEVVIDRDHAVRMSLGEPCELRDWECQGDLFCGRAGIEATNAVCCEEIIHDYRTVPTRPKVCKEYANLKPLGADCDISDAGRDCDSGVCAYKSGATYASPTCCEDSFSSFLGFVFCKEALAVGDTCSDVLGLGYDELCDDSFCGWKTGSLTSDRVCCTDTFTAGLNSQYCFEHLEVGEQCSDFTGASYDNVCQDSHCAWRDGFAITDHVCCKDTFTGISLTQICKNSLEVGDACSNLPTSGYDKMCRDSVCAYGSGEADSWQYCCESKFQSLTGTDYCRDVLTVGQTCADWSTYAYYLDGLCLNSVCAWKSGGATETEKRCCVNTRTSFFGSTICDD